MAKLYNDHWLFWQQFREQFHTTGAVLPSGRRLAQALSRYVGENTNSHILAGRRVLEVGPGTGAVTAQIVRRLGPDDQFDLVELNDAFVRRLEQRFAFEEEFQRVAPRARVLHRRLEDLDANGQYDLIVSGLPLNNFSVADVEQILAAYGRLLRPGGTLSFFQYIAIRPLRAVVSGAAERTRLRGIGRALEGVLGSHEIKREWIWPNLPPAWVHHVRGIDRGPEISG